MIRRTVKIQLALFVVILVVGVTYVGINYVGIHVPFVSSGPYTVKVELANSGGIFTNAEVTERGVDVGEVGTVAVHGRGVIVDLKIKHGKRIPANVHATVAELSAVGEQYLDLEPQTDAPPYLQNGSVIPASDTTVPLDDATILVDLDRLLNSVNTTQLATVIDELGKGFQGVGPALQSLIDNGSALTKDAIANLPQQLKLINDGVTVLDTQRDVATELKSWAASFASFSDQLRVSDPALRGVLDNGVGASKQLQTLLQSNEAVLPTLLGNLVTFNQIQAVRLPYVRGVLELFPSLTAGGFYVTPGDGTAHFGMVNDNNSNPCTTGYSSTKLRGNNDQGTTPSDWGGPGNLDAYCHGATAAANQAITSDQRGSRTVPRPAGDNANITNADPYPGPKYGASNQPTVCQQDLKCPGTSGTSAAGAATTAESFLLPYDPTTGLLTGFDGKTYQLGYDGPLAPIFGSNAWEWLLLAPTMK